MQKDAQPQAAKGQLQWAATGHNKPDVKPAKTDNSRPTKTSVSGRQAIPTLYCPATEWPQYTSIADENWHQYPLLRTVNV